MPSASRISAGRFRFDPCYDDNCLVNVVAVGIAPADRILRSRVPERARRNRTTSSWSASRPIAPASAGPRSPPRSSMRDRRTPNRGAVQIHDPFLKRVLVEATQGGLEAPGGAELRSGLQGPRSRRIRRRLLGTRPGGWIRRRDRSRPHACRGRDHPPRASSDRRDAGAIRLGVTGGHRAGSSGDLQRRLRPSRNLSGRVRGIRDRPRHCGAAYRVSWAERESWSISRSRSWTNRRSSIGPFAPPGRDRPRRAAGASELGRRFWLRFSRTLLSAAGPTSTATTTRRCGGRRSSDRERRMPECAARSPEPPSAWR